MNDIEPSRAVSRGGVTPVSKRVMNLSHFLRQAARRHPGEIGLVWGERCWRWADLDRRVDAMAAALAGQGVVKGDRVLVQARNCNQLVESMFVCFRLGAVWVPTNFRQTPSDIAFVAVSSGASVMIHASEFDAHLNAVQAASPDLRLSLSLADYDAMADLHDGEALRRCRRRARRPLLVLLHLRNHRTPKSGGADARGRWGS